MLYVLCVTACRSGDSKSSAVATDSVSLNKGTSIPFKYHGHLYFPVTINDSVRGNFVFDTGGDDLYIDTLFFDHALLPKKNVSVAYLSGIGSELQKVKIVGDRYSCRCGLLTLKPPHTFIMNIRPILGRDADGVVGLNMLRNYIFSIDYIKEEMRILNRNEFSTQGYEKIPFSIRNNRIYLKAAIQVISRKKIEGEFLLDLGNGGSLDLTSYCARINNLNQIVPDKVRTYSNWGGVGGPSSDYRFRIDTFYIGKQKIVKPVISYSNDNQGALSSGEYIGLIGNDIMDRFDLIVNMPDSCLYLRPNQNISMPYQQNFAGFAYVDRTDICEGWVVRALYEGLAAEKAGLQIGDVVIRVNGRNTKDISWHERKYLFSDLQNRPYILAVIRDKHPYYFILNKVE